MQRKIGLLTADGETAATNAVIQGVLLGAMGDEVVGFMRGWAGLLFPGKEYVCRYHGSESHVRSFRTKPGEVVPLTYTPGLAPRGGTILKTSRTNPGIMDGAYQDIAASIRRHALDVLVVIGEIDSIEVAAELGATGLNSDTRIVFVPNTINDDVGTAGESLEDVVGVWTMGFPSAVRNGRDHLFNALSTVVSKERVYWLETMGRNAGWLALGTGYLADADMILVPEHPVEFRAVLERIREVYAEKGYFLGVVAEGFPDSLFPGVPLANDPERVDPFGHPSIAGAAEKLVEKLERLAGKDPLADSIERGGPGYGFRGGAPLPQEVQAGISVGVTAVRAQAGEGVAVVSLALKGSDVVPRVDPLPGAVTMSHGAVVPRTVPMDAGSSAYYDAETFSVGDLGRRYFDLMGVGRLPHGAR